MTTPDFGRDRDLEHRVRRLSRDVDAVTETVAGHKRRLEEAEATMNRTVRDVNRLVDRDDKHDAALKEHAQALLARDRELERCVQLVRRLENAVRIADGVPEIDLDDVPASIRELATTADRRHELKARLLPRQELARHEEALKRYPDLVAHAESAEDELVRLIKLVACAHREDPRRLGVTNELAEAAGSWKRLSGRGLEEAVRDRQAAQRALEENDAVRAWVSPRLTEAERAWTEVTAHLRERITDAIGGNAVLPRWFTETFGVAPPRGMGAERWVATATAVLAYRVTYDIHDRVVALGGGAPKGRWPGHRGTWHSELESELGALDSHYPTS